MWEQTSRVAEEVSIIYMYSSGFLNKGKMDKKKKERNVNKGRGKKESVLSQI
jgi:hypothetical protein